MIAVDTNILIYAHRAEMPAHDAAAAAVQGLANAASRWTIPWPCVHEFIGTVTRGGVLKHPSSMDEAFAFVRDFLESRSFSGFIGEGHGHLDVLERLATAGRVRGAKIHDARIAAICIAHGVTELWTADRDFLLFPDLRVRNPLVSSINE